MCVTAHLALALLLHAAVQRTLLALDAARRTVAEEGISEIDVPILKDWALSERCAIRALAGEWSQAGAYARQRVQMYGDQLLLPMGLCSWYETEALLRGGDEALARAEVKQLAKILGNNRRFQLVVLRSRAVLTQWDGDMGQANVHLESALALARGIGLAGEAWPIWGELGKLYVEQGEMEKAREAYGAAGVIIHRLADTIDDELREGFMTAVPVRSVLENSAV